MSYSLIVFLIISTEVSIFRIGEDSYIDQRNRLLHDERELRLGTVMKHKFTDKEKQVHEILLDLKRKEFELKHTNSFPPKIHYFKAKDLIEKSKIFSFIKKMPKGALLHVHNTAGVSSQWVLNNATYRDGLWICKRNTTTILTFRHNYPYCTTEIKLLSAERKKDESVIEFDANLKKSFDLFTTASDYIYSDTDTIWKIFPQMFSTVFDVIHYLPVFKDYHHQLLEELYEDNIMYAEIRGSFPALYDGVGQTYNTTDAIGILQQVVQDFCKTHPKFIGFKIIYAIGRNIPAQQFKDNIKMFKELLKLYPDFVIGFDMVGNKESGSSLFDYSDELRDLLETDNVNFFFHAGETNWYGSSADLNLLDSILLKTRRIGHAFSLYKHPILMDKIKKKNIAIEVSPLSNQILGLLNDLRNHPAAVYIANNLNVVITNDDPGFWNSKGLSYDMFYALMAIGPYDGGLEILKQLVTNSIESSILTIEERRKLNEIFKKQWMEFLNEVLDKNL